MQLHAYVDNSSYITEDRLDELICALESCIEVLLYNHKSQTLWMDPDIKTALANLCEEDCIKSFKILIGRLEKWSPNPVTDAKAFFLKVIKGFERPIFEGELVQMIFHFQEDHPRIGDLFTRAEIFDSLARFKRGTVDRILKTFGESLEKNNGTYVKVPRNYLLAVIQSGVDEGRWK